MALIPPAGAVADLGAVVDGLAVGRAQARLMARERWHITVVFLGEVPPPRAERAAEAVVELAAGTAPFSLRLAGGGTFGRGPSTILWSGVDGDLAALGALSTAVRQRLRRARLPYDRKPLRPHLTIARPGERLSADDLRHDLATLAGYGGPAWPVTAVHVLSSETHQTPTGPQPHYTPLATAPLLKGDPS